MAYVDQPGSRDNTSAGGCVFCAAAADPQHDIEHLVVHRGKSFFVILNLFPYNNGHLMVVPYAHFGALGDLDEAGLSEMMRMTQQAQAALDHAYHPEGYNIGMNLGRAAGAGIADHIHLHIVPRWNGDTNFMPVLGDTKVLPDALESSCRKIRDSWTEVNG